ncbi:hypothetical protein KM918_09205 [Priestia megaterium]|nr:hypothetical protein [Priestia megaterium]MBU8687511.1 hypothetical protein [Priestia megaterium]
MIEGQGKDSCGKSGTDETPQERKRRGAQATRRLSGRPRKAKPCMEINCGVISGSAHGSHLFVFRLDLFGYVTASLYIYYMI